MPLNAKKGAASYSNGGTRVPTAPLLSCLTCPLCTNLFRDATTISECLHTFCRECIHNRLNDGETSTCPVCNVSLGTVPLEKLRADHQLNDVKLKLFPETVRKRKNGPSSSPAVSGAPTRRKERSLYSLGIGAQPSLANPGFATRTTRRSSGKSVAGRDSSSSDDIHEEADEMDDEDEEEEDEEEEEIEEEEQTEDDESHESQGVLPDPASPIAASNSKGYHVELSSDEEEIFPPRPSRAKEEPRRAPLREPSRATNSEVGMYLAHRSMLTANGFSRTRSGNFSNPVASEDPLAAGAAAQDERNSNADSLLATLAEVAGADSSEASRANRLSHAELSRAPPYGLPTASPDLARVREANNDAKSMDNRPSGAIARDLEGMTLRASPPRARRSSPQLQKNHHSLKPFANGSVERPGILKHPTIQHPPPANGSYLASTSFGPGHCGIWFALQAARNQSESPLPQLSSPYLRIKDGKLPVSHVKKYLVKKLGLNNETEVEITCRGQPVVSSLPLESVRNIWFATAVPSSKDQDDQSQTSSDNGPTGLIHLDNSSAKELIMVLTYQRHRRNPRIC